MHIVETDGAIVLLRDFFYLALSAGCIFKRCDIDMVLLVHYPPTFIVQQESLLHFLRDYA